MNQQIDLIIEKLNIKKKEIYLWIRIDDVKDFTPALKRVIDFFYEHCIPLLLAVIPLEMTEYLVKETKRYSNITVGQHGYSHKNYSPQGFPNSEFPETRSIDEIISEQLNGKALLQSSFQDRFFPILIPPYFEIGNHVRDVLDQYYLGFSGWWTNTVTKLRHPCLNVQIDFINWDYSTHYAGAEYVEQQLFNQLYLFLNEEKKDNVIGIVLHPEEVDEASFQELEQILNLCKKYCNIHIINAREAAGLILQYFNKK